MERAEAVRSMRHALITRYAVRFAEDNLRRRFEERDNWLEYRLGLFHKYTLPSVQAQTYKDFDWWIVIDPTFPGIESHIEHLSAFASILKIQAYWKEAQVEIGEALRDTYNKEWVCSTRLDSDDIIANDFMMKVVELAQEKSYVGFPNGYMLKDKQACDRNYDLNSFVSYVEYADPFESVFRTCHTKVNRPWQTVPLILDTTPMWIQVDHSDNIKNLVEKKIEAFDKNSFDAEQLRSKFTWSSI